MHIDMHWDQWGTLWLYKFLVRNLYSKKAKWVGSDQASGLDSNELGHVKLVSKITSMPPSKQNLLITQGGNINSNSTLGSIKGGPLKYKVIVHIGSSD